MKIYHLSCTYDTAGSVNPIKECIFLNNNLAQILLEKPEAHRICLSEYILKVTARKWQVQEQIIPMTNYFFSSPVFVILRRYKC